MGKGAEWWLPSQHCAGIAFFFFPYILSVFGTYLNSLLKIFSVFCLWDLNCYYVLQWSLNPA